MTTDYDSFDVCSTFEFTATPHFARNWMVTGGFTFGGSTDAGKVDDCYHYAVEADSWSTKTVCPQGDGVCRGIYSVAHRIGLVGGFTDSDDHYNYVPATDSYSVRADLPYDSLLSSAGRNGVCASQYEGFSWAVGGYKSDPASWTDATLKYSHSADTWAVETNYVAQTSHGACATTDAAVHVTGGWEPPFFNATDLHYSMTFPTTVVWTAETLLPVSPTASGLDMSDRSFHCCEWVGDRITIWCGDSGGAGNYKSTFQYNTATSTWIGIANYFDYGTSVGSFAVQGAAFGSCGYFAPGRVTDTKKLNNATSTWESRTPKPVAMMASYGGAAG